MKMQHNMIAEQQDMLLAVRDVEESACFGHIHGAEQVIVQTDMKLDNLTGPEESAVGGDIAHPGIAKKPARDIGIYTFLDQIVLMALVSRIVTAQSGASAALRLIIPAIAEIVTASGERFHIHGINQNRDPEPLMQQLQRSGRDHRLPV